MIQLELLMASVAELFTPNFEGLVLFFFPVVSEEGSPRLVALLWTGINTIQNPEEASSPEFKMMMPHYLEQTCTSVQLNYPNNQNQHKTPVKSDV